MNSATEKLIARAGEGLSEFHKDLIWQMLEQDFEYGGTYEYDYDELVRCLKEEPDFAGVEEKCAHYYLTILNSGFDEDYREFYGLLDFDDEYEEGDFEESAKMRTAKRSLKEYEDAAGKYSISWEKYERFGSGGVCTKSFSAKDDLDAILKIKKHRVGPIFGFNILVDDTTVYEGFKQKPKTLEDAVADSGYDNVEEYIEDCEPLTSVESILEYMEDANGDGDDYIFYIKRPDGTYLFKADDADADDDWDDED